LRFFFEEIKNENGYREKKSSLLVKDVFCCVLVDCRAFRGHETKHGKKKDLPGEGCYFVH